MKTKLSILIVEDNEEFRDSLEDVLADNGFAVSTAGNGKDAINMSQNSRYDIALVDLGLPDISGTNLVADLASNSTSIEFIIMTANASLDSTIEAMRQERVISYELKPLEMDHLLSVINQVAKRRKAERQLQKLTHAVEQSSSTILITDTKGNIEYTNPRFTQLTGYTSEDALGKNPRLLKSGRTPSGVYKELWDAIEAGNDWKGEFCNLKKNGELYWEFVSISPVKDDKGAITNFIAVKDDITERKKREAFIHAQHAIIQVLAESNTLKVAAPKILQAICEALEWDLGEMWELDNEKKLLLNTEIWNIPSLKASEFKAATRQITFSPQTGLPGRVWKNAESIWVADVVRDTNFKRAAAADRDGLHGAFGFPIIIGNDVLGTFCFFSREIRKPDKELLDMMSAIGRQIGLFIKRKQAEETLIQTEKLKSMGMITAGIAHDFNNILAIISGMTQLLELDNEDNKELISALHTISKVTDDGAKLVRRMRMFTKQEKDSYILVPVDIKDVLEQAIGFVKPRWMNIAKAGGIDYDLDRDGIVEVPIIMGTESELREVFINIMNNAMDAMYEGGRLSFRTWQNEGNVLIGISDTGEGMPEEVRRRVFEPFYTTKREKGSGLGMSVSYGIIERHGGRIEVKSEVGKGTTFTISLPITISSVQNTESPVEDQRMKPKGLNILVVDDIENMRSLLKMFLVKNGHTVKTAESGGKALEVLKTETFDLVLCDLVMPDMSGHEVVAVLNKLEKRPKIGIITGWSEKISTLEELNVDFIAKKPFKFTELSGFINKTFSDNQ